MNLKSLASVLIFFLLIFIFFGCSNINNQYDTKTEFSYWTVNSDYAKYHENAVEEWNLLYPEKLISLDVRVFEAGQIKDKLWTTLHSGILVPGYEPPDLVDLQYQDFDEFVSVRNTLLHPILNREEILGSQFEAFTYRDLCFGIPFGMDKMVMYYNSDLLSKAGIDIEDIKTWDDLEKYGIDFYKKTGKSFISIDVDHYDLFITMLTQNEVDFTNTALGLKSEKSIEIIDYLTRLVTENVAQFMPGGRSDSKLFYEAFNNGEIAVFIDQLSNASVISRKLSDLQGDIGIEDIPQMNEYDAQPVWMPNYATAVTMACEDYTLLKEFLEFARLTQNASDEMLTDLGASLGIKNLDSRKIQEDLNSSKFAGFYKNDIFGHYENINGTYTYLPNVTTVKVWIDGYEAELAKEVFSSE